jgi:hypothetical protein
MVITLEKSEKHQQTFHRRPIVAAVNSHFQEVVKPFIETPFVPIEVDKLANDEVQQKKNLQKNKYSMSSAQLIGPVQKTGPEKPTMYSTVITRHPTVIKHQTPQPKGVGVHPAAAGAFAADSQPALEEKKNIPQGAYSIPVQVNSSADSLKDGFEIPNFIHTGEKKVQESEENLSGVTNMDPAVFLKNSMEKDLGEFLAQFDNSKDKAERIVSLVNGKKKLQDEMKCISLTIQSSLNELLMAKEIALRLTHLNNYYSTQIKKNSLSNLKLSDIITIKNILINKIQREMQGLRTAPADYPELNNVNPQDIEIIMKDIKLILGQ